MGDICPIKSLVMAITFGDYLNTKRKESGFSIKKVSDFLKMDPSTYGKIERNEREIPENLLSKISKILNIKDEKLLDQYYCHKLIKQLNSYPNYKEVLRLVNHKMKLNNSNKENNNLSEWVTNEFKYPKRTTYIATLFSGIGAIEYSFKRLGLNTHTVFASDIDKFVKEAYFANYDIDEDRWYDDVKNINGKKYKGKIDLLVGGSPCQSFSMVGKRKGLEDTRGTLFYEFARIIKESQPKSFIFENVKGLINHDKGNTFDTIKATFDEMGYNYFYQVLNAKDYGMPQHRERIFVVGFKNKSFKFEFPNPIKLEYKMQDFLEDFTESKYYLKQKGVKFVTSSKNRKKRYTQINGDVALCQKANQQFNWHGDFIFESKYRKEFDEFIFDVNEVEEKYYLSDKVKKYVLSSGTKNFKTSVKTDLEVARPLLQSMHKMHRAGVDNYVTHNKGRIRKLTPKECLRLMGFRDDFKQVVSDTQTYRQAGNSIVVDVLIAILKQMDVTKLSKK